MFVVFSNFYFFWFLITNKNPLLYRLCIIFLKESPQTCINFWLIQTLDLLCMKIKNTQHAKNMLILQEICVYVAKPQRLSTKGNFYVFPPSVGPMRAWALWETDKQRCRQRDRQEPPLSLGSADTQASTELRVRQQKKLVSESDQTKGLFTTNSWRGGGSHW